MYTIKRPSHDEFEKWKDVYINQKLCDPHTEFAQLLNIPRQDAKKRCYEIAYTVPFIQGLIQVNDPDSEPSVSIVD